ncbi:hypothetical protein JYU34_011615 [Plutella xylostella]|uniref:Uncharacterized protein n=1 Tax=Plutella xylostella TaxID=51655 RepID=A0ABQ7QHE3_PLUXY|nr:hypothetical protein JYU34_011615 [Plutella xylostella]
MYRRTISARGRGDVDASRPPLGRDSPARAPPPLGLTLNSRRQILFPKTVQVDDRATDLLSHGTAVACVMPSPSRRWQLHPLAGPGPACAGYPRESEHGGGGRAARGGRAGPRCVSDKLTVRVPCPRPRPGLLGVGGAESALFRARSELVDD